jgi:Fe(3+) dicitrate transport protein
MVASAILPAALTLALPVPANAAIEKEEVENEKTSRSEASPRKSTPKPSSSSAPSTIDIVVRGEDRRTSALQEPAATVVAQVPALIEQGHSTILGALSTSPALVSMQGNAGLGSTDLKLNVAARGVDPRFSQRTAVLLDGVPMSAGVYGRPQFELVPLPLLALARIEVSLSGISAEVGPHTTGGIIRLESAPIPKTPQATIVANGDQWGRLGLAALFSTRLHERVGMQLSYTPRVGTGERMHDDFHAQAGSWRASVDLGHAQSLEAAAQFYWEDSEIPGGLTPAAFAKDPRSSQRQRDSLSGYRIGGSLRWKYQPSWRQEASVLIFGSRTDRVSSLANGITGEAEKMREQPRNFNQAAIEPRLVRRARLSSTLVHEFIAGARSLVESDQLLSIEETIADGSRKETADDRFLILGNALYLKDEVALGNLSKSPLERIRIRVGGRLESAWARSNDTYAKTSDRVHRMDVLPDLGINLRLTSSSAIFAAYGHTFGPPHALQLRLASDERNYRAERGRSAEIGYKWLQPSGISIDATAWLKIVRDYADVSLDSFQQPGDTQAIGGDFHVNWRAPASSAWRGIETDLAYTYTYGTIEGGTLDGKRLPWYPDHRARARVEYHHRTGWFIGSAANLSSTYYTDFDNTKPTSEDGGIGEIPAFLIADLFGGYGRSIRRGLAIAGNLAVKNLGNTTWYTRTSDRNSGILPLLPRTFYASLMVHFGGP